MHQHTQHPDDAGAAVPVYRYQPDERVCGEVAEDPQLTAAVMAHLEEHAGAVETVLHEIVADLVRLDIAVLPPAEDRPFLTLSTLGMSARRMAVPEKFREFAQERAELILLLPPDWDLDDPDSAWPIEFLKAVGRLPFEYDTWLGIFHTVPNGHPPTPLAAGTLLSGVLIAGPLQLPQSLATLTLPSGEEVAIYTLVFLTADELAFKVRHGAEPMFPHLEAGGVDELLRPGRPSCLPSAGSPWAAGPTLSARRSS